jgi:hypothetical protein
MKFSNKEEQLELGQRKSITKFAYFPVTVDDGETIVWLEKYLDIYEVQRVCKARPTAVGMYGLWLAYEFYWTNEWRSINKKSK